MEIEFVSSCTSLAARPEPILPEFSFIGRSNCGKSSLINYFLGRNRLAVPERGPDHHQKIADRLEGLPDSFDLAEPFGRIRDAIEEARRGGQ